MGKQERAEQAQRLLRDSTFGEVMTALEGDCKAVFGLPNASDEDVIKAHSEMVIIKRIHSRLKSWASDKSRKDQDRVND